MAYVKHALNPTQLMKGHVVYYETGVGKTFAAYCAAFTHMDLFSKRAKIVIVTTKANATSTWPDHLHKYYAKLKRTVGKDSIKPLAYYKRRILYGTVHNIHKQNIDLRARHMLIIDEAHKHRNMNDYSRLSPSLLALSKLDTTYTILLTATPIVRSTLDLNALYSLITGELHAPVDEDTASTDAADVFQHGGVLHCGQDKAQFPAIETELHEVQLRGAEYGIFFPDADQQLFDHLHREVGNKKKPGEPFWAAFVRVAATKGIAPNPFLVNSRQMCNSTQKLCELMDYMMADPTPSIVYSNFIERGTKAIVDMALQYGFKPKHSSKYDFRIWKWKSPVKMENAHESDLRAVKSIEMAVFDSVCANQFVKWHTATLDGVVKWILLSPKGREGLSFQGIRDVHLVEPSWNSTDEQQAIARAVRRNSHTHLPPSERRVTIHRWHSTFSGATTSDERVYELSEKVDNYVATYRDALAKQGTAYAQKLDEFFN